MRGVVYDMRTMIDPAIGAMLAGAFALLFVSAALNKLRSLQHFAEVFRAYRLLPDGAARLSWLVPALGLAGGGGLLARRPRDGAGAGGGGLVGGVAGGGSGKLHRGRAGFARGLGRPRRRRASCRPVG